MLSRRPNPMIGKLSELLVAVNRAVIPEISISPRGPLDFKFQQSPRDSCSKRFSYDLGGVGLGIVAELGKSVSGGRQEIIRKCAVSGSGHIRPGSDPIPCGGGVKMDQAHESLAESLEYYTYVTCRRGPDECYTKVYKDGCEFHEQENLKQVSSGVVKQSQSPERSSDVSCSGFLSSCDLCNSNLHGKDIFMYRGEKAFCSEECRSSYIVTDERKEKCRSEVSTTPYTAGRIFSTGVFVI